MGTIYIRKTGSGKIKYYGSIYHEGKRIRKYLGDSKKIAIYLYLTVMRLNIIMRL